MNSVNVLGVKVDCLDRQVLLETVRDWAGQDTLRTLFYVNAHCLNTACQDIEYRRLLNSADLVYSDGIGVVWAGRFLGGGCLHKITGADWIDGFCEMASVANWKVAIIAGKPGIAQTARANLLLRWPGLNIGMACDGFFLEKDQAQALCELQKAKPQVVFVGLGTPAQEKWIALHRAEIPAPVCWAVGALFDFVAGVEPRVPAWMNALALEWFWRLIMDPLGKWRRYLLGNPQFIMRVFRQKVFPARLPKD